MPASSLPASRLRPAQRGSAVQGCKSEYWQFPKLHLLTCRPKDQRIIHLLFLPKLIHRGECLWKRHLWEYILLLVKRDWRSQFRRQVRRQPGLPMRQSRKPWMSHLSGLRMGTKPSPEYSIQKHPHRRDFRPDAAMRCWLVEIE